MLKKLGAFAAAGILLIGLKTGFNTETNNTDVSTEPVIGYERTISLPDDDFPVIDTTNEETDNYEQEANLQSEETIKLGGAVVLNDGCKIYTDSYKATGEYDGSDRYYSENINRYASALTYNLDGNLTTIYLSDLDYQAKIDEMNNAGAKITAALVANEYGDEGYVSINDVSSLQSESGYAR